MRGAAGGVGDRVGGVAAVAAHALLVPLARTARSSPCARRRPPASRPTRPGSGRRRSPGRASPRRCRRGSRWRRRSPRRGSGREEATIESSICVAVIDGRASAPASAITCFCTIGTSSMRISMPRSPRATITQSAARTISSARWTACGFSILAISGSRVCLRRNVTSSARRTNESATRSTPIRSPVRTWSRSSSGTEGSAAVSPGMLRPWREATLPPTSTSASISPSAGRVARHAQAHGAVGEVHDLARLDGVGQPGPGDVHAAGVALARRSRRTRTSRRRRA